MARSRRPDASQREEPGLEFLQGDSQGMTSLEKSEGGRGLCSQPQAAGNSRPSPVLASVCRCADGERRKEGLPRADPELALCLPLWVQASDYQEGGGQETEVLQGPRRAEGPSPGPGVLSYLHCCWGEPARPTPSHQSPVLTVLRPILYGLFCPKAMAPAWTHPGLTSLPELLSSSLVFISLCLGQLEALFSEQSPPAPSLGHLLLREDPMDTPAPVTGQPQCPCTSLASTVVGQVLGGERVVRGVRPATLMGLLAQPGFLHAETICSVASVEPD